MEILLKKSKGKSVTQAQKEFLVNFLEVNLEIAHDRFVSVDEARQRDNAWKTLTKNLNALGGACKSDEQWRKTWGDMKRNSKKKYGETKEAENRSGINGLTKIKQLSDLEQRIIEIMSERNVEGDEPVLEIGIETIDIDRSTLVNLLHEEQNMEPSTSAAFRQAEVEAEAIWQRETQKPSTIPGFKRKRKRTPLLPISTDKLLELEEKNLQLKEKRLRLEERKVLALESIQKSLFDLLNAIKE